MCKLGRDGGVFGDHFGHHTTQCFDAQRQGRDIKQQHVFAVARQHLPLNGRAHGDSFIWVDIATRIFAKKFFDLFLNFGHAGHAADQNHVVDVAHRHACVLDGSAARRNGAFDQLIHQTL